jgi:hypothetical protein
MRVALRAGIPRDDPVSPLDGVLRDCGEMGSWRQVAADLMVFAAGYRSMNGSVVQRISPEVTDKGPVHYVSGERRQTQRMRGRNENENQYPGPGKAADL